MGYYVNIKEEHAAHRLGRLLDICIGKSRKYWEELVFLCIGTDRITGDSLGPYIGHQLSLAGISSENIYGTLQKPVHALNLDETMMQIQREHPHALVIAIDASLGCKKHLGYITIGNGSICPGAGVHKELPAVGDIYITGIVCATGFLEHFALQNTRLAFIIAMADIITESILSNACLPQSQKLRA